MFLLGYTTVILIHWLQIQQHPHIFQLVARMVETAWLFEHPVTTFPLNYKIMNVSCQSTIHLTLILLICHIYKSYF